MPGAELVLVTGGAGFIGANLVRRLLDGGRPVRVLDDLSAGRREYIDGLPLELVEGDVADRGVLEPALEGVSHVVHLAAATSVVESVRDPLSGIQHNVVPLVRLLDAARQRGVRRFVFASSNAAVGSGVPPIAETHVPRPCSPYGASKLAGEAYCAAFSASYGLPTVVLRFANAYGEHSLHKPSAVHTFIRRLLLGEPVCLHGDGTQTRDFVHVADVCAAIELSLDAPAAGELFQVGTGRETSLWDLLHVLERVTGRAAQVVHGPSNAGEIARNSCDISKARQLLGFAPHVPLQDGLERTCGWYAGQLGCAGRG